MQNEFGGLIPYYFYGQNPYTQWTCSENQFKDKDGKYYSSTEQYMMLKKAELFHDEVIAKKIMKTNSPREIKALGRKIKGFDDDTWNIWKLAIVLQGNYLKFNQNPLWKNELVQMIKDGYYLVEASPYDKIWGIGISIDAAKSGKEWQGENLLGICLTKIALKFIQEDELLYSESCISAAIAGIETIKNHLEKDGVSIDLPANVNLIENELHELIRDFIEDSFGRGEYEHQM